jgi:hypothetical protein
MFWAADRHDRFDLYFFWCSYFGHTGRGIDWIEVRVRMIKAARAGRAGSQLGAA